MVTGRDQVKNLNAGVYRPSKLPLIDGPRMPALKLLPSGSNGANSAFFFLMSVSDVKKLNLPYFVPCLRICGEPEGNNFNASVHPPSITGSFDGRRTSAFRFFTRSASDHTSVSQTAFFNVSGHTTVSQTEFFFCHFFDVGRQ